MTNKFVLKIFVIITLITSLLLGGCVVNKTSDDSTKKGTANVEKVELELGDVENGENLYEEFDFFARILSESKDKVIDIMKCSDYEDTDYIFSRSEVLKITLPDDSDTTVWYVIEYDTENMYAVYDGQTFIVKNKELIKEKLCSLLDIDRYVLLNRDYFVPENETLDDGSLISGVGNLTYTRFFYNPELENPLVVEVDEGVTIHDSEPDMYEIADIAARTIGVKIYDATLYKDDDTGIWNVTVYKD